MDVGLDHHRQLFGLAAGELAEHLLDRAARRGGAALLAPLALAVLGDLARAALALDHDQGIAGIGHAVEPERLDRHRRAGALDVLAAVVDQRPHAAPLAAADDDVADLERAALDQHGRDHAAAAVELGLDHRALRRAVGVGAQLEDLGLQLDHLDQLVEVGPGRSR